MALQTPPPAPAQGPLRTSSARPARDRTAVEDLVRAHLPVVGYQVSELMTRLPGHVQRDELVSAGLAALAQAAVGYDEATGVPFGRYASLRIRGALLDELRGMDWAPRGARARARALSSAEEALSAQLGRRPTRDELATAMGCPPGDVDAVRAESGRNLLSLEAYDGTLSEVLPQSGPGPEEQLLQKEQVRYLHAAVTSLPSRLRVVVEGLYLDDRPAAEVATQLGVSESRVSQLRAEALGLLRDGMNSQLSPEMVQAPERPDGLVARRRQAYYAAVAAQAALTPGAAAPAAAAPAPAPAAAAPTPAPVPAQRSAAAVRSYVDAATA